MSSVSDAFESRRKAIKSYAATVSLNASFRVRVQIRSAGGIGPTRSDGTRRAARMQAFIPHLPPGGVRTHGRRLAAKAQAAPFLCSAMPIGRLISGTLRLPVGSLWHLILPDLYRVGGHPERLPRFLRAVAALQAVLMSEYTLTYVIRWLPFPLATGFNRPSNQERT